MNLEGHRIFITGGTGFLGRHLKSLLFSKCQDIDIETTGSKHDLTNKDTVETLFNVYNPEVVFHLACPMGGGNVKFAGSHQADLMRDMLLMNTNVVEACQQYGVSKLVTVGSACSYPREHGVLSEEVDLWNGYPHESHAAYGIAKRVMAEQCKAYREQYGLNAIHLILANLYGPGDKLTEKSHFIPATILKVLNAQLQGEGSVNLWGTGHPTRDLIYVEDAADAILLAAEHYDARGPLNIGTGKEVSIAEVAEMIRDLMEWRGYFVCDPSKPDGQPRRSLDISLTKDLLGWEPKTSLREGLLKTIKDVRERVK